ncbi:tRNA pseudouridine(55) synthase TruB [Sutcliffiella rhizosphaerae]|uniref:tRNA pseudouridine synthase B n=1 Tax=Sutcliffiella rhizosphaerae TaxID=2880967 RepID=A0ABM8YIG0_9BACI|nr:tRNA pseudouridine(55) synthase TruB [Sutcliffiella rhizosphaerae]CAG9619668.1 tRNA pseudouridine synthase B [Sutcliffiella rhizosphaerae]
MDGILILNKPRGLTSHDCVYKVRKILKTKKVGHTGTLDPEVTGVLPICIGRATKVVEFLTAEEKTYIAEVTIGFSTTTEDQTGEVVEQKVIDQPIPKEQILSVLQRLKGELEQTPPMYSAVKINGKKLYEYAREGKVIDRPSRKVFIHDIFLTSEVEYKNDNQITFSFQVNCSKGTYVRTLAVQIGEMLGYPAHMSRLSRISSGDFTIDKAVSLEDLTQLTEENRVHEVLLPMENALTSLPKLEINDKVAEKVKNGAVLPLPQHFDENNEFEFFSVFHNNHCLAIYMKHPTKQGLMKPKKVIHL